MERVVAFSADAFPEREREHVACLRLMVEHPAAARVAAGLEAVPFNCFGLGLFPPGRASDPDAPCLSLWYDDPHPLYWVQLRRRVDRDILICEQSASPEEAWRAAAEAVPRLLAEAASSPDGGARASAEWLGQLSPIANFADVLGLQR